MNITASIEEVTEWVKGQHDSIGQTRKGGEPYWEHVVRVSEIVSEFYQGEPEHDRVVSAALCHDWLEDVNTSGFEILVEKIGKDAAKLVDEVTNVYTPESHQHLSSRRVRKQYEAKRLGKISFDGKMIKLADIIDNLSDIESAKPKMSKLYKEEKVKVLDEMALNMPHLLNNKLFQLAKVATV